MCFLGENICKLKTLKVTKTKSHSTFLTWAEGFEVWMPKATKRGMKKKLGLKKLNVNKCVNSDSHVCFRSKQLQAVIVHLMQAPPTLQNVHHPELIPRSVAALNPLCSPALSVNDDVIVLPQTDQSERLFTCRAQQLHRREAGQKESMCFTVRWVNPHLNINTISWSVRSCRCSTENKRIIQTYFY